MLQCDHLVCRDDGDCNKVFSSAGQKSLLPCDRSVCSTFLTDYDTNSFHCTSSCFDASCDWSRSLCTPQKVVIASCPLFDATVLVSVRNQQSQRQLLFASGGSSRCIDKSVVVQSCTVFYAGFCWLSVISSGFGRCDSAGCINSSLVDFAVTAFMEGPWPGSSSALRLGSDQQSTWVLINGATKFKNLSSFTIEVRWRNQNTTNGLNLSLVLSSVS